MKASIKLAPKDKNIRKEFDNVKAARKEYNSTQSKAFKNFFDSGVYNEKTVSISNDHALPSYNKENPKAFLDISVGDAEPKRVVFELFKDKVPLTADNFL